MASPETVEQSCCKKVKALLLTVAEWTCIMTLIRWFSTHHASIGVFVSLTVAIAGGTYALIEYWDRQEETRIERTLEYLTRIQSGQVSDAKRKLDVYWHKNNDKIERGLKTVDPAVFEETFGKLENDFLKTDEGLEIVMRVFYFFNDVAACVNLGLCHPETACFYFNKNIRLFKALFMVSLGEWEKAWATSLGKQTDDFIEQCETLG